MANVDGFSRGRGGFSGGRGAYNQGAEDGQSSGAISTFPGRGAFQPSSITRGGGGYGSGRGAYNQGTEEAGSGNYRGGRGGTSNQESESGQSSRGAFAGRGRGYNQDSEDGQSGAFNNRGRGGNYNQESDGGRGGFAGRGRGNFNQNSEDGQGARGGFGGSRGNFNQESEGGRGGFAGRGRGNFNQNSEDGQSSRGAFNNRGRGGAYNQESENGQSSRGGFGERGRGNFNLERNNEDQENHFGNGRGGFIQRGTDAPAPNGEEGEAAAQPERAPMNFIPKARDLDQLYKEDEESAAAYSQVVDNDDDIIIENAKCEVLRIQNWEEADFDPKLLENIKQRSKYTRPRKIQGATIPFILDHFDVKAQAETGSGKTAAFLLPILDSCIKAKASKGGDHFESELATPYAVIIGPTRELVLQVYEQAQKFANETGVTVAKAYGQYNINRNHEEIRQGCDILVATVGRLKHFVLNEDIFVHKLHYLVLDEADRLLDQNFAVDIEAITNVPRFPSKENRITMLFSATFDNSVMEVADRMLKPDAVFITNRRNDPNKKIKQDFILIDGQKSRLDILTEILTEELGKVGATEKMRRTLVFVNTKRMSDMAALYLCQHGVPATSINGDRGQHLREQALNDFRNHTVSVLISTDVTARGIDVKHLDHVINFDLPQDSITYVHRIGRTGRITQGFATTLVDGTEPILNDIANMLRKMGPLPETLEKVLNGAGAAAPSSNFTPRDAAAPSNFAAAAPGNNGQNQAPPAAAYAGNDW